MSSVDDTFQVIKVEPLQSHQILRKMVPLSNDHLSMVPLSNDHLSMVLILLTMRIWKISTKASYNTHLPMEPITHS